MSDELSVNWLPSRDISLARVRMTYFSLTLCASSRNSLACFWLAFPWNCASSRDFSLGRSKTKAASSVAASLGLISLLEHQMFKFTDCLVVIHISLLSPSRVRHNVEARAT